MLTFLKQTINFATDRFLSTSGKIQDVDTLRRSKLVISLAISYSACGLILIPFYFLLGSPSGGLAILLSNLLIFLTVYLIKFTGSPVLAGNWIVLNVYILLAFLAAISGGYDGPLLAWLVSLPVVATILAKKNSGRIWVYLVGFQVLVFYALEITGCQLPQQFSETSLRLIQAVSLICLTTLIWLFASLYELFHQEALNVIAALSVTDDLTQLYNWQGFQTLSKQQMRLAARNAKPLALVHMELHRLEWINETYGQEQGNKALAIAAQILRSTLRESDIIARLPGDNFVFTAIPNNEADVDIILGRLILNLKNFNDQKKLPFAIFLGFGVALSDPKKPETRLSLEELLSLANKNQTSQKTEKPAE